MRILGDCSVPTPLVRRVVYSSVLLGGMAATDVSTASLPTRQDKSNSIRLGAGTFQNVLPPETAGATLSHVGPRSLCRKRNRLRREEGAFIAPARRRRS